MTSSEQYGSTYPTAGEASSGAYPSGGYVPPPPPSDVPGAHAQEDQASTAGVAKDQAANVAGGAADAAQHVAGVAKEQAGQVTAEAGRQVKNLAGQARTELSDQAQSQQQRAVTGLHSLGDQLQAMGSGTETSGMATDLAHQAAGKVHDVAGWLENREPADILNEVRTFARQRPGAFLAIALGAGIVAGRLARGMATNPDQMDNDSKNSAPRSVGYDSTPGTYGMAQPGAGFGAPQPYGYAPPSPGYADPAVATGYGYAGQEPAAPGGTQYGAGQAYGAGAEQGSEWAGRSAGQWGENR